MECIEKAWQAVAKLSLAIISDTVYYVWNILHFVNNLFRVWALQEQSPCSTYCDT